MNRQAGAYKPVFYPSIILIIIFAAIGVLLPKAANHFFSSIQGWLTLDLGWLYIVGMTIFVFLCFFLMISKLGNIKLGPDHSLPEHTNLSWFAMLFAAGMGVGIIFFSVAEPLLHFMSPPDGANPDALLAAKEAISITLFHWGLEAWSVYATVGLSLAYFSYRHRLPLLPRSVLYPLIGKSIYGPIGHAVDIFAILGTMFGIAVSLGLGATQVNAGLSFLFGVPVGVSIQMIIIVVITFVATLSVGLGLEKGIKTLSNFNIIVAVTLLLFVLFFGHTAFLLKAFVQNIGAYFSSVVDRSFNLYAYQEDKQSWLNSWTLFYWGWWIAWSPFVGMFIAKVSKGRTIREFIVGVLFIPTGFTFLWLCVFGNSALNLVLKGQGAHLLSAVQHNAPVALFEFLSHFPFSSITSIIALILIVTFFVTSSDSGSLVIDIIATGDAKKSLAWQRICWSLLEGGLAMSLLYAGGLVALQTATIASAFPLLIIIFLMAIALIKALRDDYLRMSSIQSHTTTVQYAKANASWQERLDSLVKVPNKVEAMVFLKKIVVPAIQKVVVEFQEHGIHVAHQISAEKVRILVPKTDETDFIYSVVLREFELPNSADEEKTSSSTYYRAEVFLENGGQMYDIMGYKNEQIIADIVTQYEKHLHYLHASGADKALI